MTLALQKYGSNYFFVSLLEYADTQEELDNSERKYIRLYRNEIGEDQVFNISEGGLKGICMKGKNNPMYGSHRTGSKNPNWKDGICKKKYYCSDCGKEICRGSKRCKSCTAKLKSSEWCKDMVIQRGSPWNKGKKCSSISESKRGSIPWNKGLKMEV